MKVLVSSCVLGKNCKYNGKNNYNEKVAEFLQSRSPTCGVNQIYDGSFTGKWRKGQGIFAEALIRTGYKVIDSEEFQ